METKTYFQITTNYIVLMYKKQKLKVLIRGEEFRCEYRDISLKYLFRCISHSTDYCWTIVPHFRTQPWQTATSSDTQTVAPLCQSQVQPSGASKARTECYGGPAQCAGAMSESGRGIHSAYGTTIGGTIPLSSIFQFKFHSFIIYSMTF